MISTGTLKGKVIERVDNIVEGMITIVFTDGTRITIAHDGDQLNMLYLNRNGDPRIDTVAPSTMEDQLSVE